MRDFATIHADLAELVEALADLSLVHTPDDLNEEVVDLIREIARVAAEAVASHGDVSDLIRSR
jgi:hypothetical protein